MSKRRAGTELTHDNWDQEEEEEEEAGVFRAAGKEVIAKRAIRKAKRRFAGDGQDTTGASNPFAAFGGFSSLTPAAPKKPETTLGSFSSDTSKKPATTFSGLSAPGSKKPAVTFGGFSAAAATKESSDLGGNDPKVACTPAENTAPVISSFVIKSSASSFTSNTSSLKTTSVNGSSLSSSSSSIAKKNMNPEYSNKLRSLNQSVSAWIQQHVNTNPLCDLTPVFEDYKKHLGEIEKKHGNKSTDSASALPANKTSSAPMAASSSSTTTTSTSSASSAPLSGFSFVKSTTTAPAAQPFSFKATPPTSGGTTTGFSFLKSAPASDAGGAVGAVKPFSFGVAQAQPSASSTSGGAKTEDGNEDEPPKVEFKQVEEKDAIYSKKCKLFYKKDDAYKDRGVGMLHLKKNGEKGQLLLRADTNLGNVILNIGIHPKMPATRQGKNNVLIMTAMNPPINEKCPQCKKKYPQQQESNRCDSGCTPEVEPLLLRVKTGEDADQLLEKINTFKE